MNSLLDACGAGTREEGEQALVAADGFLVRGELELAASALDRAYGLLPRDEAIARQRRAILDGLSIEEHGLVFRYVPAGSFLMGSLDGDPDERPVHRRRLEAFWITDVPLTWAAYCRLMGWSPPPNGSPPAGHPWLAETGDGVNASFILHQLRKVRLQYCGSTTKRATNWHDHADEATRRGGAFDDKPLVATSPSEAEDLAEALTQMSPGITYGLPTEAEWEKAARGGLIGTRWSWGDEAPTPARCDFDRFGAFHLEDPRKLPPNGYALHSMCGGVAEWTADRYDALAYAYAAAGDSAPPAGATDPDARVLRGGSWADCAAAVTVSFRTSRVQASWRQPQRVGGWGAPTVGFRLVRRRPADP